MQHLSKLIPGPNALLILYTALLQGKRLAVVNTLGVGLGFLIYAFISAQGLSLLLEHSIVAFNIIKWLGVAYLLWLGISNFRSGLNESQQKLNFSKNVGTPTLRSSFIKGLLTNLLNPKIALFYMSIFPQFVTHGSILEQSMTLGLIHALVVTSWFTLIILFASRLKAILTTPKVEKWLNFLSGGIFMSFSASLARTTL